MRRAPFLFSFSFLLIALLFSLALGSVLIPPVEVWRAINGASTNETFRTILFALVGAALAGSGATYQGLFRNPLADPYLIGVASGAGLGAVLAMSIRWPYTALGLMAVPMAAFAASLLTVFLVYTFAHVGGGGPTSNFILAGVALSSFAVSLTLFLILGFMRELRRAVCWLLGGFSL